MIFFETLDKTTDGLNEWGSKERKFLITSILLIDVLMAVEQTEYDLLFSLFLVKSVFILIFTFFLIF